MKHLFIASLYAPHIIGGAELVMQAIVEHLARQGDEVCVLAMGPGPGLSRTEVNGVRVYRAGIRNLYFPWKQEQVPGWKRLLWHAVDSYNVLMKPYVRQVIESERPDVITCHNISGWSVAVWDVGAEFGVPVVQVLHDQYLLCPKTTMFGGSEPCRRQCVMCASMRLWHRRKSARLAAVVGVSRFVLEKLLRYGYFEHVSLTGVIHNAAAAAPVDLDDDSTAVRRTVTFGFIGALAPIKGIERLLEAFHQSAEEHWRLRVAGTGKQQYTERLKAAYGDGRIEFLGYTRHEDFFPGVDIVVVPSLWEETFPGVVIESLMNGVPVLASNRGGIPEIMTEESGVLFDPSRNGELERMMAVMASDCDRWRNRRSSVRRSAAGYTDSLRWIRQWKELYAEVVEGRYNGTGIW